MAWFGPANEREREQREAREDAADRRREAEKARTTDDSGTPVVGATWRW